MRILFVTSHAYLPQRVGGAELSTHDLCTSMRGAVDDVAVLASLEPRGLLHARHRILHRLAGRAAAHDRRLGYRVFRAPRPEIAVAEVVRRCRPDVAILHPDRAQSILAELLRTRQRTLVYLRDVEFARLGTTLPADGTLPCIANSAFTAARALEAFGVVAPVIRPLIRADRYRTRVEGGEVVFVNPVPEKGVELALAIARRCPARRFRFIEGWRLGARRWKSLEQAATAAGNVVLQRAVLDMRPVYARATVVIVPSRWEEAWGRVVTEAQLNGIPVVASGAGGLPESVGSGGIVLDPASGVETWATEIERLFTDPVHHAALSRRAFERSQSPELAPQTIVDELLRVAAEVAR